MDLKTPRDIPENIEDWSPEIEDLLSEWGEVALCYQYCIVSVKGNIKPNIITIKYL